MDVVFKVLGWIGLVLLAVWGFVILGIILWNVIAGKPEIDWDDE